MNYDKSASLFAILALSLCAACGGNDDNSSTDPTPPAPSQCTQSVCDPNGFVLKRCNTETGQFTYEPCPYGCENAACNPNPDADFKCTQGVCDLDDKTLKKCDRDSGQYTDETCPYGCKDGACVADPTHDFKCTQDVCDLDDKTLKKCDRDSGQYTDETCPNGCQDGACRPMPPCQNDKCDKDGFTLKRCNPETRDYVDETCPYGCRNDACFEPNIAPCNGDICTSDDELAQCDTTTGKYTTQKCPNGCQNAACIETIQPPSIKIGAPCNPEAFSEFCDGDKAIFCDTDGIVAETTCDQAAGLKCATLPNFYAKSINRAACYRDKDKCNTGERQMICIDYNNSSISGYQKCYKSINGELYFDWDLNAATLCRNADKLPTSCANATQCGDAIIVETCQSVGDKCTADLGYSGCAHFADLGATCYTQTCTPKTSTPFVCDAYTSNDSSFNASQQCLAASDGKYYRIDIALCDDACDDATGACL